MASESTATAWGERTYAEIKSLGAQDGSILLVPVGSVEQHGHHLPVATDTILVDAVAAAGADCVAEDIPILRTPALWAGFSPHHMAFGGTISLEFPVMLSMVENVLDSAIQNGFDAVLLLNGHGGNIPLVSAAVSTIGAAYGDVEVLGLTYFKLASQFDEEFRDSGTGGMSHGGEFETSLMLHLRPDLVDRNRTEAEMLEEPYDLGTQDLLDSGPLAVYRGFNEYSETGAIGAPELASAEKGERIFDRLGEELERLLREISVQNQ